MDISEIIIGVFSENGRAQIDVAYKGKLYTALECGETVDKYIRAGGKGITISGRKFVRETGLDIWDDVDYLILIDQFEGAH